MSHWLRPLSKGLLLIVDFICLSISTLRQKLLGVAQLGVEVADVDAGGHPHLLDFHHVLVLFGLLLPLGLLETVLAVVHELAHRGGGGGGNLDQVQPGLVGALLSLPGGHDAQLGAVGADEPHLPVADLLVDLMSRISYGHAPPDKK